MAGPTNVRQASDARNHPGFPPPLHTGNDPERDCDPDGNRAGSIGDARAMERVDATVVAFHLAEPAPLVEDPNVPPLHQG